MRACTLTVAAILGASAAAQVPDVEIHVDARLNYRSFNDGSTAVRWFDTLGRPSIVGLVLRLEPGLRLVVNERVEKISGDGDPDRLDEMYLEEQGAWRVGKQILPIGPLNLLRESVLAARSDSGVLLRGLRAVIAGFDGGEGRPRGFLARFGANPRITVVYGERLAQSASSLALIRRPDDALSLGTGYRSLVDVDLSRKWGDTELGLEFVLLRDPNRAQDRDEEYGDLHITVRPSKYRTVTLGVTRAFEAAENVFRATGEFLVVPSVWVEPTVRYKDGKVYDFGISLHVKL